MKTLRQNILFVFMNGDDCGGVDWLWLRAVVVVLVYLKINTCMFPV